MKKEKKSNLIAFGIHVTSSLLNSSFFSFKKAIISENYHDIKKTTSLLKEKKIPFQILGREFFSRFVFEKKNQGIVLFIDSYHYKKMNDLFSLPPKRKFYFFLLLDGITDPQNFGSIIRTSAALNLDGIIIETKNQVPVTNAVIKVSSGGISSIPIFRVSNISNVIENFKKKDFLILSSVCLEESLVYYKQKFTKSLLLVLGNEHLGIRKEIIKKSDKRIYIPVFNKMNSLNVSVCCGIICSHLISSLN